MTFVQETHLTKKAQIDIEIEMDKGLKKFASEMRALRDSIQEEMEKNEALASVVNA